MQDLLATRRCGWNAPTIAPRFSYQSVLERGFALVRDDGHPLRSAARSSRA
jgi:hypothetical protein